jgi:hypothetical protein
LGKKIPEAEKGRARDHAAKLVGVNPRYASGFRKIRKAKAELAEKIRKAEKRLHEPVRELKQREHNSDEWAAVSPIARTITERFFTIFATSVEELTTHFVLPRLWPCGRV